MPYFLLTFFLGIFLLILPDTGATEETKTPRAAHRKNVDKLDMALEKTERLLHSLGLRLYNTESTLENLRTAEQKQRNKLGRDLYLFNEALMGMLKTVHLPQDALALADGPTTAHHRRGVLRVTRRAFLKNLTTRREKLSGLLKNRDEQEVLIENMRSLRATLKQRREHLRELRSEEIKLLALSPEAYAQLQNNSADITRSGNIRAALASREGTRLPTPKKERTVAGLPAPGRLVQKFDQPTPLGVNARGITISSLPSAQVTALRDGRVIYSGPFREYGYLVILEHQNGLHSLYSGLDGSGMKVGDFALAGQPIGYMPARENPPLYLELRDKGTPRDPLVLLKSLQ